MFHGDVASSCDEICGHRSFIAAPGIHCFKEDLVHKAEGYSHVDPLFNDGVFWSAMWEIRVNRSEKNIKKNTERWIQSPGRIFLEAIWMCGRRYKDMKNGSEFRYQWNPLLEANPLLAVW